MFLKKSAGFLFLSLGASISLLSASDHLNSSQGQSEVDAYFNYNASLPCLSGKSPKEIIRYQKDLRQYHLRLEEQVSHELSCSAINLAEHIKEIKNTDQFDGIGLEILTDITLPPRLDQFCNVRELTISGNGKGMEIVTFPLTAQLPNVNRLMFLNVQVNLAFDNFPSLNDLEVSNTHLIDISGEPKNDLILHIFTNQLSQDQMDNTHRNLLKFKKSIVALILNSMSEKIVKIIHQLPKIELLQINRSNLSELPLYLSDLPKNLKHLIYLTNKNSNDDVVDPLMPFKTQLIPTVFDHRGPFAEFDCEL